MTKVIVVGDLHAMDKPPASVADTYMADLLDQLRWIAEYSKAEGVEAVVWAGDIFSHKQPSRTSHFLVLRMIEIVQFYRKLGIELLIVIGNHDISNDVVDSVKEKQPLGVLFKAGARELKGWHKTLPLFGVPWQQRWLEEETPWEAFADWRAANVGTDEGNSNEHALAVTHAPIYPPATRDEQLFELVPTAGKHGISRAMDHMGYLYYGHIHEDHGIWEDEGVTYANMGALSRGSLTEYNVNRTVKVALWTEEGFTEIPVPSRPADEVFNIAQATEIKNERLSLDKFLLEVGNSSLDISSTESVVAHIQSMPMVDAKVKATAIEILEEIS